MWMFVVVSLGTIYILRGSDVSLKNQYDSDATSKPDWNKHEETDKSIEDILDNLSEDVGDKSSDEITTVPMDRDSLSITNEPKGSRRYWLVSSDPNHEKDHRPWENYGNDKDNNLKHKILSLVDQQLHDTEQKVRSLQKRKEKYKDDAPYQIGFILSLVKRSKLGLTELFNAAIKHRDDYKALQEMKIFELIVHANVDTTNLVRQMVEIHIRHLNSSQLPIPKRRIVLL